MIQVYAPQSFRGNKRANSPYLPQQSLHSGGGVIPIEEFLEANFPFGDVAFGSFGYRQVNPLQVIETHTNYAMYVQEIIPKSKFETAGFTDFRYRGSLAATPEVFDQVLAYETTLIDSTTLPNDVIIDNWVLMPKLSNDYSKLNETMIIILVGQSGLGSGSTPNAVYDSTFNGVYHFEDTGIPPVKDSTSNGNDSVVAGFIFVVKLCLDITWRPCNI